MISELLADTLECLAQGFVKKHAVEEGDIVIPMIDARRREVYMRIINNNGISLSEVEAKVIDASSFDELLKDGNTLHLIGDGALKFEEEFREQDRIVIHHDYFPSACYLVNSAIKLFEANRFEDVAYFEPYYLKDFIAIKPRKIF